MIGVIGQMLVERGDLVRRGQLLARMDARVEVAALQLAQARVAAEAELRAASAQVDFAQKKAERTATLTDMRFVSSQAREQTDTELSQARMRLDHAREQQGLAEKELQLARAQVAQRSVTSPIDGVVVERHASVGERIENRPVFRIAQIDPLRVELVLPAALFGRMARGAELAIQPELPGMLPRLATVAIVDRVIDPASNTFRVRLDLPNPDQSLPSGMRCRADLPA
ncbi:MAG: efflux RND transporter periplasmic adaptor subunit [Burkholderiales bacterium]|nr:efflux RND transporter periplasmic adaptor subunit [Burkholderiales bacterium]